MKIVNIAKVGAAAVAAVVLTFAGAGAANAATSVPSGHVDAVLVTCDASGNLSLASVIGEDPGVTVPQGQIGNYQFDYDSSTADPDALSWASNLWTATGDEDFEDDIPFIGFRYEAANEDLCPETVQIDARRATGLTNTGNAVFTANEAAAGGTSTAVLNTSRVTLTAPYAETPSNPSHVHGQWTFAGPSTGGVYNVAFDAYAPGLVGTITPVQITVS